MKKILIAPWGKPDWDEVSYIYDKEEIKAKSSLVLLQKKISADKAIIIGLDTLASSGKNYDEIMDEASKGIESRAEEFGIKDYEIIIAPGVGTFPNGTFSGCMLDYYNFLFYRFAEIFVERFAEIEEVHLDLTHGINFMPVLTYRSLREIVEIINIFKKIRFVVYNADPYTKGVSKRLHLNIVEDTVPVPFPPNKRVKNLRTLNPHVDFSPEERRKLYENDLKIQETELSAENISAFLGALYNGLPLALFSFYPSSEQLLSFLKKSHEVYKTYIRVKTENALFVERHVKFTDDFKACVSAWLVAEFLRKKGLISSPKDEVEINELKNLNENLFSYDPRWENLIKNDLHRIEEDVKANNFTSSSWTVYNKVLDKQEGPLDFRNFLAHSGFERNAVELKRDGELLYCRYVKKHLDTIKKFCCKGML